MALCTTCGGRGQVDGTGRDPCYSCGGRGSGCTACGGTGVGSGPRQETCWSCGGSGRQADNLPSTSYKSPGRAGVIRQGKLREKGQVRKPWSKDEFVVLALSYAVIVWALIAHANLTGWPAFIFALPPSLMIARNWKGLFTFTIIVGGTFLLLKSL